LKDGTIFQDKVLIRSNDSVSLSNEKFNFFSVDSLVDNLTPQAQGILGLKYWNPNDP